MTAGTAHTTAVDLDLAEVRIPEHARHATIHIARGRTECQVLVIEVFARSQEESQFQKLALQERHSAMAFPIKLVGGFAGIFLIGLHHGANTDGVTAIGRVAIVTLGDFLIQVVPVQGISTAAFLDHVPHLVADETLGHVDSPLTSWCRLKLVHDLLELLLHAECLTNSFPVENNWEVGRLWPRVLLAEKLLGGFEPLTSIFPRELLEKILNWSTNIAEQ